MSCSSTFVETGRAPPKPDRRPASPGAAPESGMDVILIEGFRGHTIIGIHGGELDTPQLVRIDLAAGVPRSLACATDRIEDAIDYGAVRGALRDLLRDHRCRLLEALAETVAQMLLRPFRRPLGAGGRGQAREVRRRRRRRGCHRAPPRERERAKRGGRVGFRALASRGGHDSGQSRQLIARHAIESPAARTAGLTPITRPYFAWKGCCAVPFFLAPLRWLWARLPPRA